MLYWILSSLASEIGAPTYQVWRAMAAAITAFLLCLVFGPSAIRALKRRGAAEGVRDFGVLMVASKLGTPTMGGVIIVGSLLVTVLLWCDLLNRFVQIAMLTGLAFGVVGFIDDRQKVRAGSSEQGLSRKVKYLLEISLSVLVAVVLLTRSLSPFSVHELGRFHVPLVGESVSIGWTYLLVIIAFLVCVTNSVNVTDGLDGLAAVPAGLAAVVLGIFAYVEGHPRLAAALGYEHLAGVGELSVFCAAVAGASAGFLWHNAHPATVFMGDTGSLALGGALGAVALLTKQEILFLLAGGVFVIEGATAFIQDYVGLQLLGRRIFFRSPLHYSWLHQGLGETKVTVRMWIMAAVFAILALGTMLLR